ncbi:MAG: hypothetical protein IJL04_01190 [Bacteroidales bacterium]|nr:hypothetical protein [Bacteroidales bacterium]
MKRLFLIIALFAVAVSGFGQDRPVFHLQDETITIVTDYGANISGTVTRSVYGKVRIVTDPMEHADLRVWFSNWGEAHDFDVSVVNRAPKEGEWQFVTRKGEEDYTIELTDWRWADVFVLVTEGYNPQTKKNVQRKQ